MDDQVETRVVIDQRQRVARPLICLEEALEVDLPKIIGCFPLIAFPRRCRIAGLGGDQPVTMQHIGDGTGTNALVQQMPDLATATGGVLLADGDHLFLKLLSVCMGLLRGFLERSTRPAAPFFRYRFSHL